MSAGLFESLHACFSLASHKRSQHFWRLAGQHAAVSKHIQTNSSPSLEMKMTWTSVTHNFVPNYNFAFQDRVVWPRVAAEQRHGRESRELGRNFRSYQRSAAAPRVSAIAQQISGLCYRRIRKHFDPKAQKTSWGRKSRWSSQGGGTCVW